MTKKPVTEERLEELGWNEGIASEYTFDSYEGHPAWRKGGKTIIRCKGKYYWFEDHRDFKGKRKEEVTEI